MSWRESRGDDARGDMGEKWIFCLLGFVSDDEDYLAKH